MFCQCVLSIYLYNIALQNTDFGVPQKSSKHFLISIFFSTWGGQTSPSLSYPPLGTSCLEQWGPIFFTILLVCGRQAAVLRKMFSDQRVSFPSKDRFNCMEVSSHQSIPWRQVLLYRGCPLIRVTLEVRFYCIEGVLSLECPLKSGFTE